jgi:hypothetical protein
LEPAPWKSVLIEGRYRYPLVTLFLTATAAWSPAKFPTKVYLKGFCPFMESVFQIGFG